MVTTSWILEPTHHSTWPLVDNKYAINSSRNGVEIGGRFYRRQEFTTGELQQVLIAPGAQSHSHRHVPLMQVFLPFEQLQSI